MRRLSCFCIVLLLIGAGPAPVSVQALRQRALGDDLAESNAALAEVAKRPGDSARDIATAVLTRDRQRIDAAIAALNDGLEQARLEQQLTNLRRAAHENLAKLAKDQTLVMARDHHTKLTALLNKLNALHAHRSFLIDLPERLGVLRTMMKLPATLPSDAPLLARIEKTLGQSIADARAAAALNDGRPPRDAAAASFWLYRASRQIEAYNGAFLGTLGRKELAAISIINAYREALGVLPMEVDARLVQAARRHSKEMVDLKYFDHYSPTAGFRSPADRMRQAGYDPGFGYSENIAEFVRDPQMLFDAWFRSPAHHKGFIGAQLATVGIGKWDHTWTLDMASNERLMTRPDAAKKVAIKGTLLPAQDERVDEGKPPRKLITETRIYDPRNPDPSKRRIVEREVRE